MPQHTATVRREVVPAWSASSYLALAGVNAGWFGLGPFDRTTLQGLAVEADDRGVVVTPRRHATTPECPLCSSHRLRDAGFLAMVGRVPFVRRLVLPPHQDYLAMLDEIDAGLRARREKQRSWRRRLAAELRSRYAPELRERPVREEKA